MSRKIYVRLSSGILVWLALLGGLQPAQAASVPQVRQTDANATAAPTANGFGDAALWHNFFCVGFELCRHGDFNGDGKDDIITFLQNSQSGAEQGDVWVALSTGQGFAAATRWHDFFCLGAEDCQVGDFNGDGKADIAAFVRSTKGEPATGDVWVALSDGATFGQATVWHNFFCVNAEICATGDFNGDGKDDIVTFVRSSKAEPSLGDVWVALSNGAAFGQQTIWHTFFCVSTELCQVGDFDGDGKADVATFVRSSKGEPSQGDVWVARSTGASFVAQSVWHEAFCVDQESCAVGDFDGDDKVDALTFTNAVGGGVDVALSTGANFAAATRWHNSFCPAGVFCTVGDFNGDGQTDILLFKLQADHGSEQGKVYVALATVTPATDPFPYKVYLPLIS